MEDNKMDRIKSILGNKDHRIYSVMEDCNLDSRTYIVRIVYFKGPRKFSDEYAITFDEDCISAKNNTTGKFLKYNQDYNEGMFTLVIENIKRLIKPNYYRSNTFAIDIVAHKYNKNTEKCLGDVHIDCFAKIIDNMSARNLINEDIYFLFIKLACEAGSSEMFKKMLLLEGIEYIKKLKDKQKSILTASACFGGNTEIIHILEQNKIAIFDYYALEGAIVGKRFDIFDYLLTENKISSISMVDERYHNGLFYNIIKHDYYNQTLTNYPEVISILIGNLDYKLKIAENKNDINETEKLETKIKEFKEAETEAEEARYDAIGVKPTVLNRINDLKNKINKKIEDKIAAKNELDIIKEKTSSLKNEAENEIKKVKKAVSENTIEPAFADLEVSKIISNLDKNIFELTNKTNLIIQSIKEIEDDINCFNKKILEEKEKILPVKNKVTILDYLLSFPNLDINQKGSHDQVLLLAIKKKDLKLIELLLEQKEIQNSINIDQRLLPHYTPLHLAIKEEEIEIVKLLLKQPQIEKSLVKGDYCGLTPLYLAVEVGNLELIELLLKYPKIEECFNIENKNGINILQYAIIFKNLEIIKLLLSRQEIRDFLNKKDSKYEQTCFYWAIGNNNYPKIFNFLLKQKNIKKNINEKDKYGNTLLNYTIKTRGHNRAEFLLDYKDIINTLNEADNNGETPLHCAVKKKENFEKVKLLLSQREIWESLNKTNNEGKTPLYNAIECENFEVVKLLLSHPWIEESFNKVDANGRNILHLAIEKGNIKIIELLFSKSKIKDILNKKDKKGKTPLDIALGDKKDDNIIRLMLRYEEITIGSESVLIKTDTYDYNLMEWAIYNKNLELIKFLLKFDGIEKILNIKCSRNYGIDDYDVAQMFIRFGSFEMIELLFSKKEMGDKINNDILAVKRTDFNRESLLHLAVMNEDIRVIMFLLNKTKIDFNLNVTDRFNQTPFELALELKKMEIIKLLLLPLAKYEEFEFVKSLVDRDGVDENFNTRDASNGTLLHWAVMNNDPRTIEFFLNKEKIRKQLNEKDNENITALHVAIQVKNINAVRLLLDQEGIVKSLNEKDIYDMSPLDYAIESKNLEMVKLLLSCKDLVIGEKEVDGLITNFKDCEEIRIFLIVNEKVKIPSNSKALLSCC